ncbi:putative fatty acyl-CoA reductase CG5065 [Condylostylus longicornis]|uniref:putative fatty acyl-CoA reductase CG5065 n=1 Tax=Condylostylus longicornis TaxID=2530218 RepID=UPI00244DB68B|nr:putative fatty acyl-CoA reductase CG5065 [Condylostylus longicornis]
MDKIEIKEFYKGRDVFITGGLGFLGKVLIEKLLRSCGDLNRIFVLVRAKKNKAAQCRLNETLSTNLFDILRNKYPDRLKKVIAVNGDVASDDLGLNESDLMLMSNVSIIFHSAATVRFNETMRQSILINTKGTHEVMKFAQKLSYVKAIVHVSTTYCNLDRLYLEEKVYSPYADWKDMIKAALDNDEKALKNLFSSNTKYKHNTYTISKHLAEQCANDYKDILPVLIFRPAIVIPVLTDPLPGWVDNWNGPIGICAGIGSGIVRTFYADPSIYSEYTPVDSSARCMIVAAYAMGTNQARVSDDIPVYNCSRPYKNYQVTSVGLEVLKENPMEKTLWAPDNTMTSSPFYFHLRFFLFQMIPAIIVDIMLLTFRQKPFLYKLQKRVYKSFSFMAPFLQTQWNVSSDNVRHLDSLIPRKEIDEFGCYDHMIFDLHSYMKNCITGVKVNLLKEPEKCSKKGLLKYQTLVFADRLIRILFYTGIAYVLFRCIAGLVF